jgi:hypothetical protein
MFSMQAAKASAQAWRQTVAWGLNSPWLFPIVQPSDAERLFRGV